MQKILALAIFATAANLFAAGCPSYVVDHVFGSRPLVPAAFFLHESLRAADLGQSPIVRASSVSVAAPLVYRPDLVIRTQIHRGRLIFSTGDNNTVHAKAKLGVGETLPEIQWDLKTPTVGLPVDVEQLYRLCCRRGVRYGPYFQRLRSATLLDSNVAKGVVEAHPEFGSPAAIHPTVLDAALHVLMAFADQATWEDNSNRVAVPAYFNEVHWDTRVVASDSLFHITAKLDRQENSDTQANYELTIHNSSGELALVIQGASLQVVDLQTLVGASAD